MYGMFYEEKVTKNNFFYSLIIRIYIYFSHTAAQNVDLLRDSRFFPALERCEISRDDRKTGININILCNMLSYH